MKIAIFGSIDEAGFSDQPRRDNFVAACKELGAELARAAQTLVTLGGKRRSADIYVAEGFLQVVGASGGLARIIWVDPGDRGNPFEQQMLAMPNSFSAARGTTTGWFHASLAAIELCDAVVTLGGADGVLEAGGMARGARKRLIPIGSFKGASSQLLAELQKAASAQEAQEWGRLALPWTPALCKVVFERLQIGRKPRIVIIHGRSTDWSLLKDSLQNDLGLPQPVVMMQQPNLGKTLPEKWEAIANQADAAIAVVTPDDLVEVAGQPNLEEHARQNVWLEVGFVWGRLGRGRFRLLIKNGVVVPTDLQGLEWHGYQHSPLESFAAYQAFVDRLRSEIA